MLVNLKKINIMVKVHAHFNGQKYVGEFKNDKYHGKGAFHRADGVKFVGEFKDGKIVQ